MRRQRWRKRHWLANTFRGRVYELLLALCLLVLASFAMPSLAWVGSLGYSLIAIVLSQLLVSSQGHRSWRDRSYRVLGVVALVSQLVWLFTPLRLSGSGVPLVLSWSLLVGWSVIRLMERLATEPKVTRSVLMGAAAGYVLIGLTAGLVMSAVETIQPNSFEPLESPLPILFGANSNVLETAPYFGHINYYAFVCLTTLGFGDITPTLPLARMLSVITGMAGPLYLATVMGVLIGRYTSDVNQQQPAARHSASQHAEPRQASADDPKA